MQKIMAILIAWIMETRIKISQKVFQANKSAMKMLDLHRLMSVLLTLGSSIKDVPTNLGIFGTPLPLARPVHIWVTTPRPPVRADTRLALFETLQLVNNLQ